MGASSSFKMSCSKGIAMYNAILNHLFDFFNHNCDYIDKMLNGVIIPNIVIKCLLIYCNIGLTQPFVLRYSSIIK